MTETENARTAMQHTNEAHDVLLHKVSHFFGRNHVLKDVSLTIRKGEFFGILGPSGSGKTTAMRIIGGFIFPTSGEVYLQNEPMGRRPAYLRNTTMVFQHLALFPHMKVFDNLAYGLKIRRVSRGKIKDRVSDVLEVVHLKGFEYRYPKQLSGGQQQRVALARALILEPAVVLFDEPLGSLDLKLRREMQIEIKNIQRRLGTTFIYVTHDQQEALNMCDRIAIMNDGKIEQVGTAQEIYERPETLFVANFIGDANFLRGKVIETRDNIATVESDGLHFLADNREHFQGGESVVLCVRPERVLIGENTMVCDTKHRAKITDLIYFGAIRRCMAQLPNRINLKADLDTKVTANLHVGDNTTVGWHTRDGTLLSESHL
jgi:ABC-type Fe3+/spermidine/putrescine transport system ATPase subunit